MWPYNVGWDGAKASKYVMGGRGARPRINDCRTTTRPRIEWRGEGYLLIVVVEATGPKYSGYRGHRA